MKFPELKHLIGNVKIIAFCGFLKSGKTESAKQLQFINSKFKRLSFASPLKDSFAQDRGIPREDLDHRIFKEQYREDIQNYSEPFLASDPYFYTKQLFAQINVGDWIVIDDLRRLTELEVVKFLNGVPYQIYAEESERVKRGWIRNPKVDNHWSEQELNLDPGVFRDLGGGRVYNNRTIDDLNREMYSILVKTV